MCGCWTLFMIITSRSKSFTAWLPAWDCVFQYVRQRVFPHSAQVQQGMLPQILKELGFYDGGATQEVHQVGGSPVYN